MTGPLDWNTIYFLAAFAAGVLAVWWRIETRIEKSTTGLDSEVQLLHQRVSKVVHDLAEYKLEAAKNFASHEHLKEVEVRLTSAIDRLTNRIEALPTKFAEEVSRLVRDAIQRG